MARGDSRRRQPLWRESSVTAVPGGNTVCLPYLASVIRLSDEIDITAARNSHVLSEIPMVVSDMQMMEYRKHDAVKDMTVEKERFTVLYRTDSPQVEAALFTLFSKMQKTLDECRAATNGRRLPSCGRTR